MSTKSSEHLAHCRTLLQLERTTDDFQKHIHDKSELEGLKIVSARMTTYKCSIDLPNLIHGKTARAFDS